MSQKLPVFILAGGRSRRFGSDKARALLHGTTLLEHVAQAVAPLAVSVRVVAQAAGAYADLGFETIADPEPDGGPLAGLLAACRASLSPFLLLSCDQPGVDQETFSILLTARRPGDPAVCFRTDRWQPMPGIYDPAIAPRIELRLAAGHRDFQSLLDALPARAGADLADWSRLKSLNTVEDWKGVSGEEEP